MSRIDQLSTSRPAVTLPTAEHRSLSEIHPLQTDVCNADLRLPTGPCPGFINYTFDDAEGHHKALITFTLRIRRKTLFYTVNLIIPCVLISFLSVCVFYLPADAGEKMTMCISILLALVVFLLLVSKILPPTSITIPLIAKYLLFTFIMNIVTILITVIIINWNFKTPRTRRLHSRLLRQLAATFSADDATVLRAALTHKGEFTPQPQLPDSR